MHYKIKCHVLYGLQEGVITPEDEPTHWVSSLAVAVKKDEHQGSAFTLDHSIQHLREKDFSSQFNGQTA